MSLRSAVKPAVEEAAHRLGAVRAVRFANRRQLRILMYHRFSGPASELRARLTSQCEHLRRHYLPMSLTEIADAIREEKPLPPNTVAVTVDDGYRDFALAHPVFRDHGLKVTLYAVSGFASGDLWLWPDQLLYLLENSPRSELDLKLPDGTEARYPLLDRTQRQQAFQSIAQAMIGMSDAGRRAVLGALPDLLELSLPKLAPDRFAALTWDELRTLAADGLDVGAHTRTHPIVSRLETAAAMQDEIAGAKARIEAAVGLPVNHFCYPNGKFADVNPGAVSEVKRAGYRTAVLAESGFANPKAAGLFEMKRMGVEPDYEPRYFERYVAGYGV